MQIHAQNFIQTDRQKQTSVASLNFSLVIFRPTLFIFRSFKGLFSPQTLNAEAVIKLTANFSSTLVRLFRTVKAVKCSFSNFSEICWLFLPPLSLIVGRVSFYSTLPIFRFFFCPFYCIAIYLFSVSVLSNEFFLYHTLLSLHLFLHVVVFHTFFFPLQARKLYRSMVLEKKQIHSATIIAAYFRGWKVTSSLKLKTNSYCFT